ncbi:MAG: DUF2079 domain-containing protein, partial [bacterium]|nr:DUF2079 domain-containing protein [bacterium]
IYAVGITFAMQRQYFNGRMLLCDHALNEQALWSALHGHGFFSECAITKNLFGEHSFFIMLFVLPVYAIFQSPDTLFATGAIFSGLTALFVYKFAGEKLGATLAVVFSFLYLLSPAVSKAAMGLPAIGYGFHAEILFPCFFLGFLYYFERSPKLAILLGLIGLSTSEMNAFPLFMASGYFYHKKIHRKPCMFLAIFTAAYFLLSLKVLIPMFAGAGEGRAMSELSRVWELFQQDPLLWLSNMLIFVLTYIQDMLSQTFYLPLLALLAPEVLVLALPTIGPNLLVASVGYTVPLRAGAWHNSAVIGIIFFSAVVGLSRLIQFLQQRKRLRIPVYLMACVIGLLGIYQFYKHTTIVPFLGRNEGLYAVSRERVAAVRALQDLVPDDVPLSVDSSSAIYFITRRELYSFPDRWDTASYIVIDQKVVAPEGIPEALSKSEDVDPLFERDSFVVYKQR